MYACFSTDHVGGLRDAGFGLRFGPVRSCRNGRDHTGETSAALLVVAAVA